MEFFGPSLTSRIRLFLSWARCWGWGCSLPSLPALHVTPYFSIISEISEPLVTYKHKAIDHKLRFNDLPPACCVQRGVIDTQVSAAISLMLTQVKFVKQLLFSTKFQFCSFCQLPPNGTNPTQPSLRAPASLAHVFIFIEYST